MNVLFDDQIASRQRRGGISRYFAQLIVAFKQNGTLGVNPIVPMFATSEHYTSARVSRRPPRNLADRRRLLRLANKASRSLIRSRADIVHHTYYEPEYLEEVCPDQLRALTVYDMIPELMPDLFPEGNPHMEKKAYVAQSDLIICISESTKRDLLKLYGPQRASVVVTPLAVDSGFSPRAARVTGLPQEYVLFVGNRAGYKDFDVLAESFAETRLPGAGVTLVAVGGGGFSPDELDKFLRLGIDENVLHISLPDEDLPGAYAHARCFVFPSRYEGFGLPTLEAMACGCPTILAQSSSHPEVGGDAAAYFVPEDADALARTIDAVCEDSERRNAMRAAGLRRAELFTWDRTAELTARAYGTLRRT